MMTSCSLSLLCSGLGPGYSESSEVTRPREDSAWPTERPEAQTPAGMESTWAVKRAGASPGDMDVSSYDKQQRGAIKRQGAHKRGQSTWAEAHWPHAESRGRKKIRHQPRQFTW